MNIDQSNLVDLLASIAARRPTPGGGAVAAITAALAAALGEMVVRYRLGKDPEHEAIHAGAADALARLRAAELQLADADVAAFERLSAVWKLPAGDPQRQAELADAVDGAIDPPRRVLSTGLDILAELDRVRETIGTGLRSDMAIAALLAQSAVESAAWNVRVNLPQLNDPGRATELEAEADESVARARGLRDVIERTCRATGAPAKTD